MNGGPSTSGKPYSNLAFLLSVGDRPIPIVQAFQNVQSLRSVQIVNGKYNPGKLPCFGNSRNVEMILAQ